MKCATTTLTLTDLLTYAPQSNRDLYLNRDFKAKLRCSDYCSTPSGLLEKTAGFMQFLFNSPERVQSYLQDDSVIYDA